MSPYSASERRWCELACHTLVLNLRADTLATEVDPALDRRKRPTRPVRRDDDRDQRSRPLTQLAPKCHRACRTWYVVAPALFSHIAGLVAARQYVRSPGSRELPWAERFDEWVTCLTAPWARVADDWLAEAVRKNWNHVLVLGADGTALSHHGGSPEGLEWTCQRAGVFVGLEDRTVVAFSGPLLSTGIEGLDLGPAPV